MPPNVSHVFLVEQPTHLIFGTVEILRHQKQVRRQTFHLKLISKNVANIWKHTVYRVYIIDLWEINQMRIFLTKFLEFMKILREFL